MNFALNNIENEHKINYDILLELATIYRTLKRYFVTSRHS